MLTLQIPEISATAGDMNDGFVRGEVRQSLFTAVLTNSLLAPNVYVVRKDKSVGSTTFTDISTSAIWTTPFELFGSAIQMSAGDGILLSCDHEVKEMWFDIDTAGVGSWGVLEVYYSSNGKTFDKLHTNIVDGTNAFKTTGVKKISFDLATHSALSPVPEDITDWTVLDTRTAQTGWTTSQIREFTISPQGAAYRYYRINISANNGDALTQAAELYLYDNTGLITVPAIPGYATNTLALAGGLTVGQFYRSGADPDVVSVVH